MYIRSGCFIVSFIVPDSVLDKLTKTIPEVILQEYNVTKLEIAEQCIYIRSTTAVSLSALAAATPQPTSTTVASQVYNVGIPFYPRNNMDNGVLRMLNISVSVITQFRNFFSG